MQVWRRSPADDATKLALFPVGGHSFATCATTTLLLAALAKVLLPTAADVSATGSSGCLAAVCMSSITLLLTSALVGTKADSVIPCIPYIYTTYAVHLLCALQGAVKSLRLAYVVDPHQCVCVCVFAIVQDPFEISHDLGRTVDRQTSGVLHKEFERAACIFRDLPQPLDKLMEPYRAGKSD